MNLLKIIFLINYLLILINSDCIPDDERILKLDKIRKYEHCEQRTDTKELAENNAYKCCYLHYKAETRNVKADVHTCVFVTLNEFENIKDTIEKYEDSHDAEIKKIDCKGFDLQMKLLFLLLLFLY